MFACPDCDKKFSFKCHFDKHRRIQTGEKPFVCSVCSKTFKSNSELKRHRRVHTGEKPFARTDCDKKFCQEPIGKTSWNSHW